MPWPYSTLPDRIVTSPSRPKSSHRASTGLAARLSGSAADTGRGGADTGRGDVLTGSGGLGAWPAARSTARTIRPWVPQRHRLPSRAALTSFSAGAGFSRSRSTAVMIMPAVQYPH